MYYRYYGFKEPPFNLTPNPHFFFESSQHTEALNTLLYAINQRKGFVVLTGDIGSGKTTVCRKLINKLSIRTRTALITNTHISGKDLLMSILDDLEIDYTPGSKAKLLFHINNYLIEQLKNDYNVVLIIDEAQNLTPSVLEEVRMLSNLETENEKLIQIVFIGQPELKKKLALSRLEQLRQRIAVYYDLSPLNREETINYIRHRLNVARGDEAQEIFTPEAFELIYEFSKGVPRLINQICDSALLSGYIYESDQIAGKIMCEAIGESPTMQLGGVKNVPAEEGMLIEKMV
ncbi:MAG: AAA family ATPase [Candidatus Omnitrophica bacterium]|nr:AAA family ATPase [Candidatus Omnitrophota bacterium]